MSSMPLPALAVKPPQQQDTMGQFANLLALKNQIQEAPLRQQALQQQIQSGQLQLQQQQLAVQNQKAMTQAFQQWDGKNYGDLAHLALQAGASGDAVMALQQHALAVRDTASQIAQRDAQTGQANLDTLIKRNGLIAGKIAAVSQLPDDQLAQGVSSAMQELQGQLDPQHLQQGQALLQGLQSGQLPADRARQALDMFRKSFLSDGQIMEDVKNQAQTDEAQSATAKNTAETKFYQQNGGAPGVPTEAMQQADWLKKNPGKGPSDYKLWTLQHTPSALVMGNMLAGPQNQNALDFAANNYRLTGQMPPGLYRSPGTTQAIIARAAQLDQQNGGAGIAANKADLGSLTDALKKVQSTYSQVSAFEQTAEKNLDLLQQTAQKIPDLGAKFANVPVRMITGNMIGTNNMAAFKTALNTAQTEAAKVLNSSNASGVLSDSARHELQDIINGNMTYGAMVASMNTLRQDMRNRNDAYQQQISDLQIRIKGAGSSSPNPAPASGPKVGVVEDGYRFKGGNPADPKNWEKAQ